MPQIVTSTVVDSPVGEVWALLRDFAAIGDWHPALPPCEIENVFLTTAPIVAGAGGVPAPAAAWRACLPGFRPLIAISRVMTREIAINADEPRKRGSLTSL